MSTIKTNTLQNAAGTKSVPVDTVVDGSAKAWVNFNGTGTVAIRAAFNVSSITDLGTGNYRVNFTNALADANYAAEISTGLNASGGINASFFEAFNTGSVDMWTYSVAGGGAGAYRDTANVFVVVFD